VFTLLEIVFKVEVQLSTTDNTPVLVIDKPLPTIIPPKVLEVAIDKIYLLEFTHLVVAKF
jgi:hypothetical protein